jgi:hypothetical protein
VQVSKPACAGGRPMRDVSMVVARSQATYHTMAGGSEERTGKHSDCSDDYARSMHAVTLVEVVVVGRWLESKRGWTPVSLRIIYFRIEKGGERGAQS